MSVLERFVKSNSGLKTVALVDEGRMFRMEDGGVQEPPVDLGIVVKTFLQCQKLAQLSVGGCRSPGPDCRCTRNEDFATVCLPARYRNIAVTICNYTFS